MRYFLLASLLACATACGVQGPLYLPNETPPPRDRGAMPYPYPDQPRDEQGILPDPI